MSKATILALTGLPVLAFLLWFSQKGGDLPPLPNFASAAAVPAVASRVPLQTQSPRAAPKEPFTLPADLPKLWRPISLPDFNPDEQVARAFDLTPEQLKLLEKALRILKSDVHDANGALTLFRAQVHRKPGDHRARRQKSETAIYVPAKREPWVAAHQRLKAALDEAMGREKAKLFLARAEPLLAPSTGNFGRCPRIGILDCYERNGVLSYRFAWRTGAVAYAGVAATDFSPNGKTMRELEKEFIKFPSRAVTETFKEIPPHLSKILEAPAPP